jgi:polyphosphate kinase
MGSSDLMPRNLSLRVETLFPVLDKRIMASVKKNILDVHLSDNVKARELRPDGTYVRIKNGGRCRSQEWFIENRGIWNAG